MPRQVLQPAAQQTAPVVSRPVAQATPAPAPKPATVEVDPYAALAAQLKALGLPDEGVAQAVAQKRAADGKLATVKQVPPPAPAQAMPSQQDANRAEVQKLQAAAIAKREAEELAKVKADAAADAAVAKGKALAEAQAAADAKALAEAAAKAVIVDPPASDPVPSDNEFAAQMDAASDEDNSFLGVVTQGDATSNDTHEETALAAPSSTAVVVRNQWTDASDGAISGEVDQGDFQMPQLKIMQGSGESMANYNQGELVFCDQVVFPAPTQDKSSPVMRFIPISLSKYWREDPPKRKNGEPMPKLKPRNVQTKAEVSRLGGTFEWTVGRNGERVKPTWSPAARILLLIEQPEGSEHPGFTIPVEGPDGAIKYWAAAVYFVNGGAYRGMAKPIIDATTFTLREGDKIVLSKRIWKMQTIKEKSGDYMVFNPKVALLNVLTPDSLRQMAANLVGSGNQPNQ